jgi:uncharacterized protein
MHDDDGISNKSNNRPFAEVLRARSSRRDVLVGSLATAATTFFAAGPAKAHGRDNGTLRFGHQPSKPLIGFEPVPVAAGNGPMPVISSDYEYQVLIPWGEPLWPGGPTYNGDPSTRPTSIEQTLQIGIGHDGMWFFPIKDPKRNGRKWLKHSWSGHDHGWWDDRFGWWGAHHGANGNQHGLLVINHEFGGNEHVLGKPMPTSLEDVRLSQHAHGVAVVEIKRIDGVWQTVLSDYARRIHVNTPMAFGGPAAGHALLQTPAGNEPAGTANNCANGVTPWGTYLTCEENFNGYFGATGDWTPTAAQERYGFSAGGFGYGWHEFDPRFDLSNPDYANEENRFGWVVEIDPFDDSMPVKRTALGRLKHEGVAVMVGRGGRVVAYMGDDEANDYVYKFVSAYNWKLMRLWGLSPLDHGRLYVARFNDDGTGDWLELTIDNPALAAQFADQGEVLTYTRMAADILGATPMDRPEWATVAPNGLVYITMTNNSGRSTPNAANPLAPNPDGHILRWKETHGHVGTTFQWEIFLIAADTHGTEESFADPDGLWADPDGRIFIQTDGGQKDGLNNQMLVADPSTREIRRLFTGVTGDEITGIAITPDRRTMFVNVQHPGDGDPTLTNFPAAVDGVTIPRDATIVIRRKDGGIIGS